MTKDLADMRATANANANSFSEMSAAKKQEIAVAQKAIVTKDKRIGALALAISEGKHALEDAQEELDAANKFLADTKDECEGKKKDRDFRAKMRTEEILAISDAVKMLNDDDALEGFAKTKPSAAFIQPREKAVPADV
jgi:chromosome segregation ATPase